MKWYPVVALHVSEPCFLKVDPELFCMKLGTRHQPPMGEERGLIGAGTIGGKGVSEDLLGALGAESQTEGHLPLRQGVKMKMP